MKEFGLTYFGMKDRRQGTCIAKFHKNTLMSDVGIVHIIGPEQGFTVSLLSCLRKPWIEEDSSLVLLVYAVILTLQVSEHKSYATIVIANLELVSTWSLWFPCIRYRYIRGRACFGHSNVVAEEREKHANYC